MVLSMPDNLTFTLVSKIAGLYQFGMVTRVTVKYMFESKLFLAKQLGKASQGLHCMHSQKHYNNDNGKE